MRTGDHLSKSRYTAGLQCEKRLWWTVHEPDAPELVPDPVLQARFDWGHRVGEAARAAAGEGVLIRVERGRLDEAVRSTRAALEAGAERVFEASFVHDGVFVAVDVLERRPRGWGVTEVKSSTSTKEEHLPDAAVQAYVVAANGLPVTRLEVMHLNRECRFPDLSNLFVREDVTTATVREIAAVPSNVRRLRAALQGPLPDVAIGAHCDTPYPCPFKGRCWPARDRDHVTTLYLARGRPLEWMADGIERLADIPADAALSAVQRRQVRAVCEDRLVVEPGLADALDAFEEPVAYLDFETVGLPIPAWPGCRPYDNVPVLFVSYAPDADGALQPREHLAQGAGDPRPDLARALVDAFPPHGTILAYNVSFEKRCVRHLAEAVPDLADALEDLHDRLDDLLPLVRSHVYHPDFDGGFGMKAVLPALRPDLAYDDLEVAGGSAASALLERLLLDGDAVPAAERERLGTDLLDYCRRDTWGLVALHRWLRGHAR